MKRELFRIWRGEDLIAVLGDERALRLSLPKLSESELLLLSRNLRTSRLLDQHPGTLQRPYHVAVQDESWWWLRDARR